MNKFRLIIFVVYTTLILSMPVSATNKILKDCPDSPNCVSSQSEDSAHHIEPIRFTGPVDEAWQAMIRLLGALKRTKIVEQSDDYLHAEVTSLIFRFVDDVELLRLPEEQLIHIRSASRTGHSDFGVNRKRVEKLREMFNKRE